MTISSNGSLLTLGDLFRVSDGIMMDNLELERMCCYIFECCDVSISISYIAGETNIHFALYESTEGGMAAFTTSGNFVSN